MADYLPLLVFPRAKTVAPQPGKGFSPSVPHVPGHLRQIERLAPQLKELQQDFSRYKASISGSVVGLEPETVLVIEIAGRIADFRRTVEATEGLEWLGEWDVEDVEPDSDFYVLPKIGVNFFKNNSDKKINGAQSKEIRDILKECKFIDDRGEIISDDLPPLYLPDYLMYLEKDIIQAIKK